MAYKNIEQRKAYDKEYFLKVRKPKYIPHPIVKKTKEEKLAVNREWYHKNIDKCKESSRKSVLKHKEQRKLDNKKWVEKNREHYIEYHKEYNKKWYSNKENKDKQNKRSRGWAKSNPVKMKKILQKSTLLHKDDIKKREKTYFKTLKGRYKRTRNSATKRNYCFELSLEEFTKIVKKPCTYCGENEKRIGVDRVDNTKGYTKKNSVPCCTTCNMMKRIMGVSEFLEHIKKISVYNK